MTVTLDGNWKTLRVCFLDNGLNLGSSLRLKHAIGSFEAEQEIGGRDSMLISSDCPGLKTGILSALKSATAVYSLFGRLRYS